MAEPGGKERPERRTRTAAAKQLGPGFVKGMANPLRIQVWTILHERVASATEISREIGAPREKVIYEMKVLADLGVIEEVATKQVRGALEHFYRAVTRAMLDETEWLGIPDEVQGDLRATLLQTMTEDAIEAIIEGQYDSRSDAHMTWTPLIVDEQGCGELAAILLRALEEVFAVQASSASRLVAQDTEGISYTVSILGYTSAHERRKVGPPVDAMQLVKQVGELRLEERERKRRLARQKALKGDRSKADGD
jgi:hypothetical protein